VIFQSLDVGTSLAPPTASLAQFSSQIPTIVRMIAVLKKQRSIGGIILPNVRQFILVDGVRGYFHRQTPDHTESGDLKCLQPFRILASQHDYFLNPQTSPKTAMRKSEAARPY
jgi:hypothetical protein